MLAGMEIFRLQMKSSLYTDFSFFVSTNFTNVLHLNLGPLLPDPCHAGARHKPRAL
jgi:hypothetical protein